MTDQDTAELVRRAAAGDELAWRQLIDGLGPLLRRVSSAYRLGEAEAADAVATAWLYLVENIGSLRDGSSVPGWLITTLRRECLARASARSREQLLADFAGVDEPVDVIDFDRRLLDADRRPPTDAASGPDEPLRAATSADRDAVRRSHAFVFCHVRACRVPRIRDEHAARRSGMPGSHG
jgi:DNA-directed RNA polymerase specialized sigma24 family protein